MSHLLKGRELTLMLSGGPPSPVSQGFNAWALLLLSRWDLMAQRFPGDHEIQRGLGRPQLGALST